MKRKVIRNFFVVVLVLIEIASIFVVVKNVKSRHMLLDDNIFSIGYIGEEQPKATEYLIDNVSSDILWDSTLEDDGYRYVGTNPDNYICFGTTDKDTCTSNTDLYMYRIIGIFEDSDGNQHLKLIKKEALNEMYKWNSEDEWNSSKDNPIDWNESDLYKGINGNYFLTNTTYSYMQDSNWLDKIATWNYTATNTLTYENYMDKEIYGPYYYYNTVKSIYLHEMNNDRKSNQICYYNDNTIADCSVGEWKNVSSKIGLMYASDYLLSLGANSLNYLNSDSKNYQTMKTGWMHLSNNDSATLSTTLINPPSNEEWTMTRFGYDYGWYYAWIVYSDGYVSRAAVGGQVSLRPVFYLTNDVEIIGDGTNTNPYLIELDDNISVEEENEKTETNTNDDSDENVEENIDDTINSDEVTDNPKTNMFNPIFICLVVIVSGVFLIKYINKKNILKKL